ncbi:sushi, von Willebrand factor type A, EGF and pentraxin domain-containing protein 1-like [Saccostrea cucullata]|uniref:sushi, von Willebrand factor type A, EGF and pentraxin domain-containing protein 1-like n=1 Tax=Saccostrea cuccullata TaxID=36930 RepID=UPI002ECFE0A9
MIVMFILIHLMDSSESGIAPTWDQCGCRWLPWEGWSECSAECGGGSRYRSRNVWVYDICNRSFSACASYDMGSERGDCNTFCYQGTHRLNFGCNCHTGWYGSCCKNQITCGDPGKLSNGHVTGSTYTYGSTLSYHCNQYYNLTGGTRTRRCQINSIWSGRKPRCAFVNSCASNPCQNNGTCVDGLDRYNCVCTKSFTGKNCETDIQPPVMSGCLDNKMVFSSTPETFINWTAPNFYDPVGKTLFVSTNYPENSWKFPWGDYTVQYVALKPSNGLRTSCLFNVNVRPHPCKDLNIPQNGAKVCNGWKTDYGEFCLVFCGPEYSLDVRFSHHQWYVCGASGTWAPDGTMPNCTGNFLTRETDDDRFRYNNCSSADQISDMQETYLMTLQSSMYAYFCSRFSDFCHKQNVHVFCT